MEIAAAGEDEERHLARLHADVAQRLHRDVNVASVAAAHDDDLSVPKLTAALRLHHELQRASVALRRGGKAHAHDVHPDGGERFGNLQLLGGGVADAGHLLAIAQRLIVDANLRRVREVNAAREFLRISDEALDRFAEHLPAFYGRSTISSFESCCGSPKRSSAVSRGKSSSSVQSKATRNFRSSPGKRSK